jgi:MFS family permease
MKTRPKLKIKPPDIFYGWYMVIGLATVGMVSIGMGGVNFGLFVAPMSEDLGIKHSYFGWAVTARLIGFSLSSWAVGKLLDRYGARIPMVIAGSLMCIFMFGMASIQSGWQLIALYFLIGAIGMQGSGSNLYQAVPLSRWFIKKRGKALAMTMLGSTAGIFIFAPLSQYIIDTSGWRSSWLILGCGGSLINILVALLIIRKDPESMGLKPDGGKADFSDEENQNPEIDLEVYETSWTQPQAIRNTTFWILALAFGLAQLSISTYSLFRLPHYIDGGIPATYVAWSLSFEAVIAGVFSIIAGWLSTRTQSRFIVAGAMVALIISIFISINVSAIWHVFAATAFMGIAMVSISLGQNILWPEYFGSKHIGSIRGFVILITMGFTAAGAPVAGYAKDAIGSYIPVWTVSIVLLVIAACLMFLVRKPADPCG